MKKKKVNWDRYYDRQAYQRLGYQGYAAYQEYKEELKRDGESWEDMGPLLQQYIEDMERVYSDLEIAQEEYT